MAGEASLMTDAFVYLSAAVVAVPIARHLGFGSVLGYLGAGVLIGPWLLGLVGNDQDVLHFAEFGVVMMLFLIGLELNPKRLWHMRGPILGLGGVQVAATGLALIGIAMLFGLSWQTALVIGMVLSLSSTAIVIQSLQERGWLNEPAGQNAFSVLLFQDIIVIPFIALIPLLGVASAVPDGGLSGWQQAAAVVAVVVGLVGFGHFLTPPVFNFIAKARIPEIFTALALLIVVGVALLMQKIGLSPALGAFLAGVVLAENEYRHEIESDIEPFKGLLLGLFFISVGASINFGLIIEQPLLIVGLALGLMLLKGGLLWFIGAKLSFRERTLFALALAQGGEFAFVLLGYALTAQAVTPQLAEILIAAVAISMLLTPLILLVYERVLMPRFRYDDADSGELEHAEPTNEGNPVLIVGFGRFGQIVGRMLMANHIPVTVLDDSPSQIRWLRKYGFKVFYGDGGRTDILHSAGAHEAKTIVITVSENERSLAIVKTVQKHFPHLQIMVRATDRGHAYDLIKAGVAPENLIRETHSSAVDLSVGILRQFGMRGHQAWRAGQLFKHYDNGILAEMATMRDDEQSYITRSHQHREMLSKTLKEDSDHRGDFTDHSFEQPRNKPAPSEPAQ
ncbi:monovalent cation:proton antiporter-2 (CPA2) family protein [Salinibius halmophilus]|uniref:monovalent cation:proton antiporter-2 (CPA2) family protein n=1 Tax=Salinibius halmophilus TaxID=1853216 RepID=UPI000E66EF70|nr:monovalent cation:proton antiporter-2 (CPA2) family protein [Salinibius halmophilus]